MRRLLRENSLSLVMFGLFLIFWVGQLITGYNDYNEEQTDHNSPEISFGQYMASGDQFEATFENWESEFLQMGAFVVLTTVLRQKGSPESKKLPGEGDVVAKSEGEDEDKEEKKGDKEPVDADPRDSDERNRKDAPTPVRMGGLALRLYENSLTIALFALFFISMTLHVIGGAAAYSHEQMLHGGAAITPLQYLGTWRMWFESFQNWQSEFLSVGALVVLTIFLRQRGSHESKPVASPNYKTGDE